MTIPTISEIEAMQNENTVLKADCEWLNAVTVESLAELDYIKGYMADALPDFATAPQERRQAHIERAEEQLAAMIREGA